MTLINSLKFIVMRNFTRIETYKGFNIRLHRYNSKYCAFNPLKDYFVNPLFETVESIKLHIDNIKL